MKLVDVYNSPDALSVLYQLLEERTPEFNISHREMPTLQAHRAFVDSRPYSAWYLVQVDEKQIGAIYLTKMNEIGIFVLQAYQGNGYGKRAISLLMERHPCERYLANINPANERSIEFFRGLGFHHIQNTYEKR